jgi:hypothetical protein
MQYPAPVQPLAPVAPSFDGNQPCAYVDPDLFFPPLGPALLGIGGGTTERVRAALRRGRGHIKHPVAVAS